MPDKTFSLADIIPTPTNLHRKARRPPWGGRHGQRVKGSVRRDGEGYRVVYSYLIGYETTARESETYSLWFLAIGQYREHDRAVRERQRLENFRAAERIL